MFSAESHPTLLAGGEQSQSGTSVYVENIILLISNYDDCCQRFAEQHYASLEIEI